MKMMKTIKASACAMLMMTMFLPIKANAREIEVPEGYTGFLYNEPNWTGTPAYWYENGHQMGLSDDPKVIIVDGSRRGREIFDPETNAWYWLDTERAGRKAESKEVWIPYVFQDEVLGSTDGKWVLYDETGAMVKGWYTDVRGTYWYDLITGKMAHGTMCISDRYYHFDEVTGLLDNGKTDPSKPRPINNDDVTWDEVAPDKFRRIDENGCSVLLAYADGWNDDAITGNEIHPAIFGLNPNEAGEFGKWSDLASYILREWSYTEAAKIPNYDENGSLIMDSLGWGIAPETTDYPCKYRLTYYWYWYSHRIPEEFVNECLRSLGYTIND